MYGFAVTDADTNSRSGEEIVYIAMTLVRPVVATVIVQMSDGVLTQSAPTLTRQLKPAAQLSTTATASGHLVRKSQSKRDPMTSVAPEPAPFQSRFLTVPQTS